MPNASSESRKLPDLPDLSPEALRAGEHRNKKFIAACIEHVRALAGEQAALDLIRKLGNSPIANRNSKIKNPR
jgi:hypothetical protein